ncbi:MAG TPA: phosphatase PAP2 family protein [Pseudogracilibacillus sp.]|nr:phosphatase PAP2 family protein [Pseudogracilibacillus sp.]
MKIRHNFLFFIFIAVYFSVIWWWLRVILTGGLPWIDAVTRGFTEEIKDSIVYVLFRWLTVFGSKPFMVPFVIGMMIVIWCIYRAWRPAFTYGLVILGTYIVNKSSKLFIARDRPETSVLLDANGYSFPSGHAMVSFVCYGLLAYFTGKMVRSPVFSMIVYCYFIIFAFLIGFSRFILNVHYPTDIVAGWGLGGIILYGTIALCNRNAANKRW